LDYRSGRGVAGAYPQRAAAAVVRGV